jgi:cytosine/adenosine deaminase-related metal-dependent hydrolase
MRPVLSPDGKHLVYATRFETKTALRVRDLETNQDLNRDVGSLEAGKMADLIVLNQNPLLDIRNTNTIRYVMKNGELYDGETLEQIWPAQKKLDKQYWWDREPK